MSIRDILGLRDFRYLWLGQIVSNFGDAVTHLTLILLINRITGGSTLPNPEQKKSAAANPVQQLVEHASK